MKIKQVEFITETKEAIFCKATLLKKRRNWYGRRISDYEIVTELYLEKGAGERVGFFPYYLNNGTRFEIGINGYEAMRNSMLRARETKQIVNVI